MRKFEKLVQEPRTRKNFAIIIKMTYHNFYQHYGLLSIEPTHSLFPASSVEGLWGTDVKRLRRQHGGGGGNINASCLK